MSRFPRWSKSRTLPIVGLLLAFPGAAIAQNPPDRGSVSILDRVSSAPIPPPDSRVIAAGKTPLTEGMSTRYVDCLAWLLELDFTSADRARLRAMLIDDWKKEKTADIKSDLDVLELDRQVQALKPEERDFIRRKLQPDVIKSLTADTQNENSQWLLKLFNEANRPIAAGDPPLTRRISDSFADLFCFILAEAGGKQITADKPFKDAWSQLMVQKYAGFTKEAQANTAKMQDLWPAIKAAWPRASEEEKNQLRAQWKQMLATVLPKDPVIVAAEHAAGDLASLAKRDRNSLTPAELRKGADDCDRVAAGLRKEGGDSNLAMANQAEQMARQFRSAADNSVAAASRQTLSPAERAARSQQAYAEAMSRLQSSHSAFTSMMNMNTISHVSNMNMIATMGGSPYRYYVK